MYIRFLKDLKKIKIFEKFLIFFGLNIIINLEYSFENFKFILV
jgi:hypothetical protein